jgi:hypothetical protein
MLITEMVLVIFVLFKWTTYQLIWRLMKHNFVVVVESGGRSSQTTVKAGRTRTEADY